ncbi:MAG TPA: hypothetical protein VFX59_00150, partial [Polyangiales bacterium]|nr:hypothetical protein [Polyangiales bacterium]
MSFSSSSKFHVFGALLALAACRSSGGGTTPEPSENPTPNATPTPAKPKQVSEKDALKKRDDLPPEQRALAIVNNEERWIDAKAAEEAGYTIVDLRDSWTPLIFHEEVSPEGQPLPNRYRRVFIGLANDQTDSDGEPLEPGEKNYLELYGISPAISVIRARFLEDVDSACHDQESVAALSAIETVSYVPPDGLKKEAKRLKKIQDELEKARKKGNFASWDELAASKSEYADEVALLKKRELEKPAMAAVEKRLRCEKLLTEKSKHVEGIYD